jgi:CheY-like chemotaxis protein
MANVIIIENEHPVRTFLGMALEGKHRIWKASTAQEADLICRKQALDLIIADIILPGSRSGTDFAMEMLRQHPEIRVLFISGTPMNDWRKADLANLERMPKGSFLHLSKPFFPDALESKLRELLQDQPRASHLEPPAPEFAPDMSPLVSRWMNKSI